MIPRSFPAGLKAIFFGLLLALLLPSLAQAAPRTLTREAIKSISGAYGFVVGQAIALDLIEDIHPALSADVLAARSTFDAAFPDAEDKLEAELSAVFGEQRFAVMRDETIDMMTELIRKQDLSVEQARGFIAGVRRRAQGDGIAPDILDHLLAVVYAAEPSAEFANGFRQRYRSDGSGKAQGLRLRMQLPRSWSGSDGGRPHLVRKWTSEGGAGNAAILLDIRDAQGFSPSAADIDAFVARGGARELAGDDGEVVDASAFALDNLPGVSAVLRTPPQRNGPRFVSWAQVYRIYFRGKALSLVCMNVGSEGESAQVEQGFRRLQPLCRQVVHSLMLEQLYE